MPSAALPDNAKREYAQRLLHAEYVEAFEHGDSDALVSTPACVNDTVKLGELVLAVLQQEQRLGASVALRMVCACIAYAQLNCSPEAEALIDHLSSTLAEWQAEMLHGRGAL